MQRIDSGSEAESERLIERGHLVLNAIASEAHAARVEAQKAELEVALSEARAGNASMLRSWLSSYHGNSESQSARVNSKEQLQLPLEQSGATVCNASTLIPVERVADDAKDVSLKQSMSWDSLLPSSRRRLEALASNFDIEASIASSTIAVESNVLERESESAEELEPANDFNVEESLNDQDDELHPDQPLAYEELPELQVLATSNRDLDKPMFRSGAKGLIVSVVAHLALIGSLMAITMRLPEQPASMGFQAGVSDGEVESIEVLQPIEVTSPSEITPEMPSEPSESALSLPSAVGLASTSVIASSSPAASASTMSGIEASANRAVAKSNGRPNASNVNATFFGAAASGNCFCYVIDGSESMRGGPWEAAKAELLRSLSSMKESHRFYIIFFNQKINAISMPGEREPASSPLYATPDNLKHAKNWVEALRIERGAPPEKALLQAIELDPDAIYLLADGATQSDVTGFLRKNNRTSDFISGEQVRVPIHAIAFYSPEAGQVLMKQVAVENKGQFIYVPAPRKK